MFFPPSKPLWHTFLSYSRRYTHQHTMWAQCFSQKRCLGDENVNFFSIQEGSIQLWKGGGGGGSRSGHGRNNYWPLASRATQLGNHSHVGPCNWCGGWGYFMWNCHDLVQELVKHTKNHHQHGGPQPKFHSHAVSEEVANNTNSFEDIYVEDVFDIAFTYLDLEKSNIL